jgi:DmsE family decaheme c-type cytochrome
MDGVFPGIKRLLFSPGIVTMNPTVKPGDARRCRLLARKLSVNRIHAMKRATLVAVVVGLLVWAISAADKKKPNNDEITAVCAQCHEETAKAFASNPHRALGANCTDCHGRTEQHAEEGGALETMVTFTPKKGRNALQNARQCLSCHKTSVSAFLSGPHGRASMDCTACHVIHSPRPESRLLKEDSVSLCVSCHRDIEAQFALNEKHRLQEGVLQCTSCHNPHEPGRRERLGGFKDRACLTCHTEKGGPFIHEHEASRIEGCTVCHEAHGSPNRHLLKHQNVAELCFSCHAQTPSDHQRFTPAGTNCVSCHAAIHGSNLDRRFLK